MSIKVMAAVWESDLPATDRLVLLALADHADDEGQCYPSVSRVCERTGLKERAVQNAFKRLCQSGYLTIDANAGRRGTNLFTVRATPAPDAPRTKCTPAPDAPPPRTKCAPTPARNAPEPSRTVKEPSESKVVRETIAAVLGQELAGHFIRHRHKLRKPMTELAAKLFVAELAKCRDPIAATEKAILKGWQTVYPEKDNEKPSKSRAQLDAFLAGARRTS